MAGYFLGWKLPESERARLLQIFKPTFPDVIADHVTFLFGVKDTLPLPSETEGRIVGYATDNERVEALIVEIGGTTARPDGRTYHVTWSIDRSKGAKPVYANEIIRTGERSDLAQPITVALVPQRFSTT